jgi:hypothetical protein
MPIYHLHVHGDLIAPDDEGVEFADLDAAKASAVIGARQLMSDEIKIKGRLSLSHSIRITDSRGVVAQVVRFGDCVTIRP